MQTFIDAFVSIVGIVMSLGYVPQIIKLLRTRSSNDISPASFLIFALGTSVWLLYGIYKADFVIIVGFIFGVVGSWSVLILSLLFRKNN